MEKQQEEKRKAEGRNRSQAPNLKRSLRTRLPMNIKLLNRKKKMMKNEKKEYATFINFRSQD